MKRAVLLFAVAACVLLADLASRPGLTEGRWARAPRPSSTAQTTPPGVRSSGDVSAPPPADSARRRVTAGEVLITTLPERVAGRRVAAYDMLRTPALSDLAGRSFFWRTRPQTRTGRHRLLFRARFDTTTTAASGAAGGPTGGPAADTLALLVTVEPDG